MESHCQAAKRRSKDFTSQDEPVLIELVKKFKNNIENKKSDPNANQIKTQSRNELAEEFKPTCEHTYRIPKLPNNNYEKMRKRTSGAFVDEGSYRFKTGGGPKKSPNINEFNIGRYKGYRKNDSNRALI